MWLKEKERCRDGLHSGAGGPGSAAEEGATGMVGAGGVTPLPKVHVLAGPSMGPQRCCSNSRMEWGWGHGHTCSGAASSATRILPVLVSGGPGCPLPQVSPVGQGHILSVSCLSAW